MPLNLKKHNLVINQSSYYKNEKLFIIKVISTTSNSMSGIGTYWDFKHPI